MIDILISALILLLFVPIILAAYWWISLPIYYCIVGLQIRTIRKLKSIETNCKMLVRLTWIQAILPIMIIVLYPIMPGNTATGEPLGLNEKAYLSHSITLIAMTVCFFTFAVMARKHRKILKTEQSIVP